jgi:hypothetical protein
MAAPWIGGSSMPIARDFFGTLGHLDKQHTASRLPLFIQVLNHA